MHSSHSAALGRKRCQPNRTKAKSSDIVHWLFIIIFIIIKHGEVFAYAGCLCRRGMDEGWGGANERENIISYYDLVAAVDLVFYLKWIFELDSSCCCVRFIFHEQKMFGSSWEQCDKRKQKRNRTKFFLRRTSMVYVNSTLDVRCAHHLKASIFNSKLTADARQKDFAFDIAPKCFDWY